MMPFLFSWNEGSVSVKDGLLLHLRHGAAFFLLTTIITIRRHGCLVELASTASTNRGGHASSTKSMFS